MIACFEEHKVDPHALCGLRLDDFPWSETAAEADRLRRLIEPEGPPESAEEKQAKTDQLLSALRADSHRPLLFHWAQSLLTSSVQAGRMDVVTELLKCPYTVSVAPINHNAALRSACDWKRYDVALELLSMVPEVRETAGARWNAALKTVADPKAHEGASKEEQGLRLALLRSLASCPNVLFGPFSSPTSPLSRSSSGGGFGLEGLSPVSSGGSGFDSRSYESAWGYKELSLNNTAVYALDTLAQVGDWPALAAVLAACPRLLCHLFGHRFRLKPTGAGDMKSFSGVSKVFECCCCPPEGTPSCSAFPRALADRVRAWQEQERQKAEAATSMAGKRATAAFPSESGIWGPLDSLSPPSSLLPSSTGSGASGTSGKGSTVVVVQAPSEGVYQGRCPPHEHVTPFGLEKLRDRLAKHWHLVVEQWMEAAYDRRKPLVLAWAMARRRRATSGKASTPTPSTDTAVKK